jgi:hypothetical protein
MGRFEVQGIVSSKNGLPMVQCRQLDDEGSLEFMMQVTPAEARDMAQHLVEASMNAVYDAALIAWAKEVAPDDDDMGPRMVMIIRQFRADIWGLPDQPEDWRTGGGTETSD